MSTLDPWRSLEGLAGDEAFLAEARRVHPAPTELLSDPVRRRSFLQLMGGSMALAGLGACTRQPTEKIYPFAKSPEYVVPGKPQYFATAMPWASGAIGLLVESHLGRPTKVEGNPDHAASLGATDAIAQASVLELYDPERSQVVVGNGRISTWGTFIEALTPALETARAKRGAGLRVLTRTVTSPTLAARLNALLAELPEARWIQYEPVNRDFARAGARAAFGQDVAARCDVGRADVVLSIDSDFLGGPAGVRHARALSERRRARAADTSMNRLYAIESTPTLTGAMADERLALAPWEAGALLGLVANVIVGSDLAPDSFEPAFEHDHERVVAWINAVAHELRAAGPKALILVGDGLPTFAHLMANVVHEVLGCIGTTVEYGPPVELVPSDQASSLRQLTEEMRSGSVELLAILGANPVYEAPVDVGFDAALERVQLRVHLGLHEDETAERCHWHVPEAHFLESWGDARAFDGTVSIVQPLIAPLYGGHAAIEVVSALEGKSGVGVYDLVREHWQARFGAAGDFERLWRRALHDGVVAGTREPATPVRRQAYQLRDYHVPPPTGLQVSFQPDPSVWDGRFANNAWLQELPKPITKLTWDNALLIAPATATELGIESGEVCELELNGAKLRCAAWITPGQALGCVTLHLGYGRRRAGEQTTGLGFDANLLRATGPMWAAGGVSLRGSGERYEFAVTQEHGSMEGRDLVRETTLAKFLGGDTGAPHHAHAAGGEGHETSMYPGFAYEGNAWGLAIDLNACIGCNACTVACQAENNIPVVGKREVRRGRELHWIRIDRYFSGAADAPRIRFQPVPCMHCENAPCEVVCPVGATVHSPEGLNEMVYNRCVGTRYCSNNCPYKVRRFNFFAYNDYESESLKLQRNPDVSVRSRGVMEKCTYCVQRISAARIEAKKEDRPIRDGEIVTACQQVCPARAITFGDINDPASAISERRSQPQHYALLSELNTKPRTTYLARLTNPDPELGHAEGVGEEAGH
jgi:molybdopterin-containing oxidoreductase family iron-sulfur binding subunit